MVAWLVTIGRSILGLTTAGVVTGAAVHGLTYAVTRTLLIWLAYIALPIILYNTLCAWFFDLARAGIEWLGAEYVFDEMIIELAGMGWWIADKMNIEASLKLIAGAVGTRLIMIFLRFA